MWSASTRAFLGFIAAAISVLTFHQGMVETLHALGLAPFTAYSANPMPPFGVPLIADLCFWGGLYGAGVRAAAAAVHLAALGVRPDPRHHRGAGRDVRRRPDQGRSDRQWLAGLADRPLAAHQRILGPGGRADPAAADAARTPARQAR